MKKFALLTAVVVLGLVFATSAHAAAPAAVSQTTINAMGIPGLVPMSDAEGLSVRGKGFHFVNVYVSLNHNLAAGSISVNSNISQTAILANITNKNVIGVVNGNVSIR